MCSVSIGRVFSYSGCLFLFGTVKKVSCLQPIFLNRTLTYMKDRMSRTHKRRAGFKVDSLLQKAVQKRECSFIQPGYINLTFLGINLTT